jgi:hypothetical protein
VLGPNQAEKTHHHVFQEYRVDRGRSLVEDVEKDVVVEVVHCLYILSLLMGN